jgi:mono/diheme cytochrome c family protein
VLTDVLTLLCVIALAVAVVWLTLRVRRSPRPAAKWAGVIGGSFFSLILLLISGLGAIGLVKLYAPRGRPVREMTVERTPERLARGQEIANTWCVGCHSVTQQLPLSGGHNLSEEAGIPLGDLYPINLTPGGPLKDWKDGEIFRALRDGADNKGHRLPVMSAQRARNLSDADIMSVIAFLRSQPAVQRETPPPNPSFLAAVMTGAGMVPSLPGLAPDTIVAPPRGPTVEWGGYMVGWMGCDECHGPNLTGGKPGFMPIGPNLRSVKGWTADGFIATMRTGKTPFGKQLDSLQMPWKILGRATDEDLTAIHAYLKTLQ